MRVPVLSALKALGWESDQLVWEPEWRVPRSPHDAASRERTSKFAGWPVDLALFDAVENALDWQHILVIFEFKAPTREDGISQLEIYLAREPRARMGYWTNGSQDVRVYRLPDGSFHHVRNAGLPRPGEQLQLPSARPLTYADLRTPSARQLRVVFEALLGAVVARDSRSTRSEDQLNQICNILLLKLDSDTNARYDPTKNVSFQLSTGGEAQTAGSLRRDFDNLRTLRSEVFADDRETDISLDDHTIHEAVYELSGWNLLSVAPQAISSAFQVFRKANLKAGEGQYFTPQRVIASAVELMDIRLQDKIIDPACGTGGFLVEAFLSVLSKGDSSAVHHEATVRTWAHRQIWGVDKDRINVKLARAMMISLGDGSANIHVGDSIRADRWAKDYSHLQRPLRDEGFTVVLTNPPFGQDLKVAKEDARRNGYSIALKNAGAREQFYDLEIGLIFLERAHRLLVQGGRLGIILPETYFFSSSYSWLPAWLNRRFRLRGVLNIPMEAFQGFCRAKTNFYVFEKD